MVNGESDWPLHHSPLNIHHSRPAPPLSSNLEPRTSDLFPQKKTRPETSGAPVLRLPESYGVVVVLVVVVEVVADVSVTVVPVVSVDIVSVDIVPVVPVALVSV